jgi:hypothetical protein
MPNVGDSVKLMVGVFIRYGWMNSNVGETDAIVVAANVDLATSLLCATKEHGEGRLADCTALPGSPSLWLYSDMERELEGEAKHNKTKTAASAHPYSSG